ncbi:MAG TPA: hypothetical protein VMF59_14040 [Bacteroidota bacterium]|nr:hypothetical protein [Bacteroidota bacterium]
MSKEKRRHSKKRVSPAASGGEPGEVPPRPQVFCTQCGATLENFCFSSAVNDLDAVRKTLAQCRKQGRFSGDLCSKLFIAHPEAAGEMPEEIPEEPGDEADDNLT